MINRLVSPILLNIIVIVQFEKSFGTFFWIFTLASVVGTLITAKKSIHKVYDAIGFF